jgi:hypothetical protein
VPMAMGRPKSTLVLDSELREQLESLANSRSLPAGLVRPVYSVDALTYLPAFRAFFLHVNRCRNVHSNLRLGIWLKTGGDALEVPRK